MHLAGATAPCWAPVNANAAEGALYRTPCLKHFARCRKSSATFRLVTPSCRAWARQEWRPAVMAAALPGGTAKALLQVAATKGGPRLLPLQAAEWSNCLTPPHCRWRLCRTAMTAAALAAFAGWTAAALAASCIWHRPHCGFTLASRASEGLSLCFDWRAGQQPGAQRNIVV